MSSNIPVIAGLVSALTAASADTSLIRAMVFGDTSSAFQ
jgi:hypothetical protein